MSIIFNPIEALAASGSRQAIVCLIEFNLASFFVIAMSPPALAAKSMKNDLK